MIRPFTCVCLLLAAGSGLYLYQTKHQTQVVDREIEHTLKLADAAWQRSSVLRAEYTLLNDPTRLADLAGQYLPLLQTTAPGQFSTWADLDRRLPAVGSAPPEPAPLEPATPSPEVLPEIATAEPPHPDPARLEPAHLEPAHLEPAHLEPAPVEPARIEPPRPAPPRADLAHVDPPRAPVAQPSRPATPVAPVAEAALVQPRPVVIAPPGAAPSPSRHLPSAPMPTSGAARSVLMPVSIAPAAPNAVRPAPAPARSDPPIATADAANGVARGGTANPSSPPPVASALGMARVMRAPPAAAPVVPAPPAAGGFR